MPTSTAPRARFVRASARNGLATAVMSVALLAPFTSAALAESPTITIDSRYRYENVEQSTIANDAHASTWRNRIGIITPWAYNMVRVGFEGEGVLEVGDDRFNNTINGRTNFPVVVDVESVEVNQAYLELKAVPGLLLKGGRFNLKLNNVRFVGDVGWRQNDQTFDGAQATYTGIKNLKVFYGWIGNVNRIFSDRAERPPAGGNIGNASSNIHLVDAEYKTPVGSLGAFYYHTDLFDLDALSNETYGLRFKGKYPLGRGFTAKLYAEYARQTDAGDNPFNYETDYYHIAPGISYKGVTLTVGYEVLGSDNGVRGFVTPLATLHKFNGFADQFLATPNTGLEDFYIDVTYKLKGVSGPMSFLNGTLFKVQYHDFQADVGSVDFGTEFDAYIKVPMPYIAKGMYFETKYADFDSDVATRADVEKLIIGVGYKAKFDAEKLFSGNLN